MELKKYKYILYLFLYFDPIKKILSKIYIIYIYLFIVKIIEYNNIYFFLLKNIYN